MATAKSEKPTRPRQKLDFVDVTPYRCSRGHVQLLTPDTGQPLNCDRYECQDNNDEPRKIGPLQTISFAAWQE